MNDTTVEKTMMPNAAFAVLGAGKLAYVREIKSDDVAGLYPDAPPIAPGIRLWALVNANGTPILIADSREAVVANAFENDLTAVSVH